MDTNCTLAKNLAAYVAAKGVAETTSVAEKQAYSYYNLMSKVGQEGGKNRRSMYKYQILKANGGVQALDQGGSFKNETIQTNKVYRLNKGQITQYPFNIPEVLSISDTHGQWYQLCMEDPELTVWYTMEDDGNPAYGTATDTKKQIYGVTPHDAANNYYIYSKGNIFYTGVGHKAIGGRPERELFVNTLIAAYRPQTEKPEILITNSDAVMNGRRNYLIRIDQEFDYADDTSNPNQTTLDSAGTLGVTFIPRDYNGSPTVNVTIYYEGGSKYFGTEDDHEPETSKIYAVNVVGGVKTKGAPVTSHPLGDGMDNTYILNSETEYMIEYPKKNLELEDKYNHIIFAAQSDKMLGEVGVTDLYLKPRPLFILD